MQPVLVEHHKFERLSREHDRLRDDFNTLLRCLEKHGGVSAAWFHAERFAATLERCPLAAGGPLPQFADVLEPRVLQEVLRSCTGAELLALKETSPIAKECVEPLQAEKLYVMGGADRVWGEDTKDAQCFDPRQGRWEAVRPMYFKRSGCVAGAIGGRIHVCCGQAPFGRFVETYNPKLQAWDTAWPAFKLSISRKYAAAATIGGRLYICGGEDTLAKAQVVHRSVEFYEPGAAGEEARGGMLPQKMQQPRQHHAAVALPGRDEVLMAIGGTHLSALHVDGQPRSNLARANADAEVLNISQGSAWKYVASMAWPRDSHTACFLNGSVYAIGGAHGQVDACGTIERWDAKANAWVAMKPMPLARGLHATAVVNGRIHVFGGVPDYYPNTAASRICRRFDPEEGMWEGAPSMLQGRLMPCFATVKLAALAV